MRGVNQMCSRKVGRKTTSVALEGSMTIERSEGLREKLLAALSGNKPVEIDLSGVTDIDLTGLQTICAVCRSIGISGKQTAVTGLRGHVKAAAETAGFSNSACGGRSCFWSSGG